MTQSTPERKLVYYVAISVDNFIAREDESMDGFVMQGQHVTDFLNSLHDFDAVLMGKNTYEWGYQFGMKPGDASPIYPMKHYIFSRSMPEFHHERLDVIREDVVDYVRHMKTQSGKSIWLCGGGLLAGALLEAELIDELILKIHPVMFGKGIRLFGTSQKAFGLAMQSAKVYANGVLYNRYTLCYE